MKNPSFKGLAPASEAASRAKRANTHVGTKPEQLLRQALWQLGLRYRKNVTHLPGKPDIVFLRAKVVVFCDGDFWHGRNWPVLKPKLARGNNASYWSSKIARNMERDRQNTELLKQNGWQVVRLWETDIRLDPAAAASQVQQMVDPGIASGKYIVDADVNEVH